MKFSTDGKKMILLDTSFLIAHYNDKDIHHTKARAIIEEIKQQKYGEVYITDYIFDECATILPLRLKDAKLSEQALILIKDLFLIHIDEIFFEETWQIFKAQKEIKLRACLKVKLPTPRVCPSGKSAFGGVGHLKQL